MELRAAGVTTDVKRASEYFVYLKNRPLEALKLSYCILHQRDEEADVWLLASQILVSAVSRCEDVAMAMKIVCELASLENTWKNVTPVRSQIVASESQNGGCHP